MTAETVSENPKAIVDLPAEPEAVVAEEPKSKKDPRREAYAAAASRLREVFRDDFEAFYEQECAKRNVPYTRKKTEVEKAQDQVRALVEQYGAAVLADLPETRIVDDEAEVLG